MSGLLDDRPGVVGVVPLVLLRFWDHPRAAGVEAESTSDGAAQGGDDAGSPMTSRDILSRAAFWLFTIPLALFIGIIVGTYSSIYTASATALLLGVNAQDLIEPVKDPDLIDDLP